MGNCCAKTKTKTKTETETETETETKTEKKTETKTEKKTDTKTKTKTNTGNRSSKSSSPAQAQGRLITEADIAGFPANARRFFSNQLEAATNDFNKANLIGSGAFGLVFMGWLNEQTLEAAKSGSGMTVAVKVVNSNKARSYEQWRAEVRCLGTYHHPNLIRLIGYGYYETEMYIVYEYMARGSLADHLFEDNVGGNPDLPSSSSSSGGTKVLSWPIRVQIAISIASVLRYLHGINPRPIICRDIKSANILLDENLNAKLSDFGTAKEGPPRGESQLAGGSSGAPGSIGYIDPDYATTGILRTSTDVYSFGVVLLELLTGRRAVDDQGVNLVQWAGAELRKAVDPETGDRIIIIDRKLSGHYSHQGADAMTTIAMRCVQPETDSNPRPTMANVYEELSKIRGLI